MYTKLRAVTISSIILIIISEGFQISYAVSAHLLPFLQEMKLQMNLSHLQMMCIYTLDWVVEMSPKFMYLRNMILFHCLMPLKNMLTFLTIPNTEIIMIITLHC